MPTPADHDDVPDLAVQARGLVKHFGPVRAVDGIDLGVRRGTVLGLLGPNGAGKTTTVRMLATLLVPDAGSASVLGHDVRSAAAEVRSLVGLTGQYASVDEDLTGTENLVMLCRLYGFPRRAARSRADQLLTAFDLQDAGGRQVKTYSGGMRRRIDLAASLVVSPRVLFLDEPTTGLDPRSRNQVWDVIRTLVDDGTTVLLTTQYLDEADQLAHRIAVIDHGKVIAEGTSAELKASVGTGAVHVRLVDPDDRGRAALVMARELAVEPELPTDPTALAARSDDITAVGRLLPALAQERIAVAEFALGQPSLDEVFLALTGAPPASHDHPQDGDAA